MNGTSPAGTCRRNGHHARFRRMKTIYYTAATLDGFLADTRHALDWLFQFAPPEGEDHYDAFIRKVGALAMGSSTYEWLLRHHVFPEDPMKNPERWYQQDPPGAFRQRRHRPVAGEDLRCVEGAVRPVLAGMVPGAPAPGNQAIGIGGGGEPAVQFYDAGLVDEIMVSI